MKQLEKLKDKNVNVNANVDSVKEKSLLQKIKDFIIMIIVIIMIIFFAWQLLKIIWESNTTPSDYPDDYEQCIGPACF